MQFEGIRKGFNASNRIPKGFNTFTLIGIFRQSLAIATINRQTWATWSLREWE